MEQGNKKVCLFVRMLMVLFALVIVSTPADAENPKEIVFGVVQAITGPNAAWGQSCWNGIQLATEIINEQGGIKSLGGAKLKAVIYDTESKPEIAQAQAEKAIDAGAVILTGSVQSAAAMLATTVAERYQVPFIAQDDDQALIERGYKYTFKIRPHARVYTSTILEFLKEISAKKGITVDKVALLCENNGVGKNLFKQAQSVFASAPEYKVIDASLYDATTTDFSGYIAKYKEAGVQIVIGHSSPNPAVMITRSMKQLNFQPLGFFGLSGGQITAPYVEALGPDANDVFSTMAWAPALKIEGLEAIKKRYEAKFKMKMDDTVSAGFCATAIAWDALERSGSVDPKKIRDAVATTDIRTPQRNYFFINGAKFDETGQNIAAVPVLTQIRDKAWIPIAPKEYTDGEAVFPIWRKGGVQ
jgi:branched-chain amino acid transport system substrate-binding protein